MTMCSWFHASAKILCFGMTAFGGVKNNSLALINMVYLLLPAIDFPGKMLNFAGLWCPNHLTYTNSWGVSLERQYPYLLFGTYFLKLNNW